LQLKLKLANLVTKGLLSFETPDDELLETYRNYYTNNLNTDEEIRTMYEELYYDNYARRVGHGAVVEFPEDY